MSNGTEPDSLMNWYVPLALPPSQEPATPPPQFRTCWTDRLMSPVAEAEPEAQPPRPLAILMRSARDDRAPCAQHDPHQRGRCWLREGVR